jgi:alkanesulfonate monooxygenase SsuD/methylene tetrahydromethanopterin reductase-like flavin-dependent oxidoreductase (luciferase family)
VLKKRAFQRVSIGRTADRESVFDRIMRDPCHRGRAARQSSAASPDRCGSRWELLSNAIGGFDLSEYDVDGPLPDIPDHCGVVTGQTSLRNVVGWAREEGLTIRQLYERFAGARGQRTLKGSPVEVVDDMEKWFLGYGVDGFLVQPAYLPGGLDDFVDMPSKEPCRSLSICSSNPDAIRCFPCWSRRKSIA